MPPDTTGMRCPAPRPTASSGPDDAGVETCQRWTAQVQSIKDRLSAAMEDVPSDADMVDEAARRLAALRSRVAALESALRAARLLAYQWKTCDAVEMEDGEIVGPSPAIAKVLRHCADGIVAAAACAALGDKK